MTGQQKIREGTAKFLYEARGGKNWEKSINREEWLNHAGELLAYLHSQGVVIKVERELPGNPFVFEAHSDGVWVWRLKQENAYERAKEDMLKAGFGIEEDGKTYAVEPLVDK